MSVFRKAERRKAKLRLAITGPAGSGKTYGALLVAQGLGGRIAMIDTENGSGDLYSTSENTSRPFMTQRTKATMSSLSTVCPTAGLAKEDCWT